MFIWFLKMFHSIGYVPGNDYIGNLILKLSNIKYHRALTIDYGCFYRIHTIKICVS